jgi:hypothetical protein
MYRKRLKLLALPAVFRGGALTHIDSNASKLTASAIDLTSASVMVRAP